MFLRVEFWCMNLYLPIGIGLFQAQNQQLLIVSQIQNRMLTNYELYKPIFPRVGPGLGGPKYYVFRIKVWWRSIGSQGKYQIIIFMGIFVQVCYHIQYPKVEAAKSRVQFIVSFIIYNVSRKFNHYGVVDHHTSPALCRRGWEW